MTFSGVVRHREFLILLINRGKLLFLARLTVESRNHGITSRYVLNDFAICSISGHNLRNSTGGSGGIAENRAVSADFSAEKLAELVTQHR